MNPPPRTTRVTGSGPPTSSPREGPGRSGRALALTAGVLVVLGLAFAAGPRVRVDLSAVEPVELPGGEAPGPMGMAMLEAGIAAREAALPDVTPGTEKAIVWQNPLAPRRTRWSVIYLHGFSATRKETEPLPQELARELKANLFLTRLTGHGRGGAAMASASVERWIRDAEEALTVGHRLGEEGVVVVAASTGASLALRLAARSPLRHRIAALLLISPNLGVHDARADLLLLPWGGQLARLLQGPTHSWEPANDAQARYWTTTYPVEALLPMQALVARVRKLPLDSIAVPTWTAFSPEDPVVDPEEIRTRLSPAPGVDRELWRARIAPGEDHHVLAGDIVSPRGTGSLRRAMVRFLDRRGIRPPDP